MTAVAKQKQVEDSAGSFAPGAGERFDWQSGERRKLEAVDARPLRWPTTAKERFDLFDAWHDVAMQLVQRARRGFRLMAVAKKVINWQAGVITNSNADLALRSGNVSEKTISRDVGEYVRLGIFDVEDGWRREGTQIIQTRTIRLSLPVPLPAGLVLPEADFEMDNSGPCRSAVEMDNSGPVEMDNSGPITIDHKKGRADAA